MAGAPDSQFEANAEYLTLRGFAGKRRKSRTTTAIVNNNKFRGRDTLVDRDLVSLTRSDLLFDLCWARDAAVQLDFAFEPDQGDGVSVIEPLRVTNDLVNLAAETNNME
jgi:hypothetical protein